MASTKPFKIEKSKFNDLRAGILVRLSFYLLWWMKSQTNKNKQLIAVFLGYAANSGITIHSYTTNKSFAGNTIYDSPNAIFLNTNTLLFLFVLAVALVFSWAYFLGARYFPKFSYICARLSYLYLTYTSPEYNASTGGGSFTAVVIMFAFVIGLQVCHVFLMPVGSGVEAVFVGMAWEPEVLMCRHPRVWGEIVRGWPKVQSAVRV